MPLVTPTEDLAERLGQMRLPDAKLNPVQFRSLWLGKTLILVHLNSFVSISGREQVLDLLNTWEDMGAAGITLAVVGAGDQKSAIEFQGRFDKPFQVLCDPELRSFEIIGVGHRKSALRTSTSALQNEVKLLRNSAMERASGPKAQVVLGATHVILPGGEVVLAWLNDRTSGVCPSSDILESLDRPPDDEEGSLVASDEE